MLRNDKSTPLLEQNLKNELTNITDENEKFNGLIQEIEKDLENKEVLSKTLIDTINVKLTNLKKHMEFIADKIHYSRNFLKDYQGTNGATNQTLLFLKNLKMISNNISQRYEKVNTKFVNLISKAQHDIGIELDRNTTERDSTGHQLAYKLEGRARIDYDRLKQLQMEYEKILQSSTLLLLLSRQIKEETERQDTLVLSIEDTIESAEENTKKAHEELLNKKESQSSNISFYFWIALCLLIIVIIICYVLYSRIVKQQV